MCLRKKRTNQDFHSGCGPGNCIRLPSAADRSKGRQSLRREDVLSEVGAPITYDSFPESGLITTLAIMRNGHSIEVGVLGNEGLAASPVRPALGHLSTEHYPG